MTSSSRPHTAIAGHAALALLLGASTAIAGPGGAPSVRLSHEMPLRSVAAAVWIGEGRPRGALAGWRTCWIGRLHGSLEEVEQTANWSVITSESEC
jgi:hypothetical protein